MCFFFSHSFVALDSIFFGVVVMLDPSMIFNVLSEGRMFLYKLLHYMAPSIGPQCGEVFLNL